MRPLSMMDAFRIMGPAFLVSVALVDPGNWATAIEAGSKFGYELVWVVVASNLIAILLQTLAARLGIVTGKHLAQVCRESYPPQVCALLWVLCEISIVALDLTMLLGTAIGLNLLLGWPLLPCIVMTSMDALLLLLLVPAQGVKKSEALTVGLLVVVVACFLVDLVVSRPPLRSVVSGLLPRLRRDSVYTAVSLLGANVMPHNFYLHSALVSGQAAKAVAAAGDGFGAGLGSGEIRALCLYNFLDIGAALGVALVINVALLLVSAATFHQAGVVVHTLQAAHDLMEQTLSSSIAPAAFGTALLCAGQLSTFTGTIAGQVVLQGFLNIHISTWLRRLITRTAAIIPAAVLQYVYGDRGTYKFLLIAQVVLALQLPVTLVPLIKATSSRQLMGPHASSRLLAAAAWVATGVVFLANLMLFMTQMLPEVSSGRGILDKDGPLDAWIDRVALLAYSDPLRAAGLVGLLVAASAFLALQLWMIVTPLRVDASAALAPTPAHSASKTADPPAPYSSVGAGYGEESGAARAQESSWFGSGFSAGDGGGNSGVGRGSHRKTAASVGGTAAGVHTHTTGLRPTAQQGPPWQHRPGQHHQWTSFAWNADVTSAVGTGSTPMAVLFGGGFPGGWVVPRSAIATVIQSGPLPYDIRAAAADAALLPLPWKPRERYQRRLSGCWLISEDDADSGSGSDSESDGAGAAGVSVCGVAGSLVGPRAALDRADDRHETECIIAPSGPRCSARTGASAASASSEPALSTPLFSRPSACTDTSAGTSSMQPVHHTAAAAPHPLISLGVEAQERPYVEGEQASAPSQHEAAPSGEGAGTHLQPELGQHAVGGRPKHPVARGTRPKFARVLEDFWATFYDAYGQPVCRTRASPAGPTVQEQVVQQVHKPHEVSDQRQRQQQQLPGRQQQQQQAVAVDSHGHGPQESVQQPGIQQQQTRGQKQDRAQTSGSGRGGGGGSISSCGGGSVRSRAWQRQYSGLDCGEGSVGAAAGEAWPPSPLLCSHTEGSHLCMGCSQALFGAVQQCLWALEQLADVEAAIWGPWPLQLVLPLDNQTFHYHRAVLLAARNADFPALQALCAGTYSSRVDHTRLLASMPLTRAGASMPPPPLAAAVAGIGAPTGAGVGAMRPHVSESGDACPPQSGVGSTVPVNDGTQQQQHAVTLLQPRSWWGSRGSGISGVADEQRAACPRPQSAKRAACLPMTGSADILAPGGPPGSSSGAGHVDKALRLAHVVEIIAARPGAGPTVPVPGLAALMSQTTQAQTAPAQPTGVLAAPTINMWCVFGPAALVSFGVWSIFTLAQWCTVDPRPAHWGNYAAVLNRLQGVLRDARLDMGAAPASAALSTGSTLVSVVGDSLPGATPPPLASPGSLHGASQCVLGSECPEAQPQPPAQHQQHSRPRARTGPGQRGSIRSAQHSRPHQPQQAQARNQQHPHHQQQQPALPDTALRLCTAHLDLLRCEVLQQLEGMEAYVLERKGPADTAAGQVAFPKAKEIMASVMRRYRRRLGAGGAGGVMPVGAAPVAAAATACRGAASTGSIAAVTEEGQACWQDADAGAAAGPTAAESVAAAAGGVANVLAL